MEYLKHAGDSMSASVDGTVYDMLTDIRIQGYEALRRYSSQLDNWMPESFLVTDEEIARAADDVPDAVKESIDFAQDQVRLFAEHQRATLQDLEIETRPGVTLGHRHIPVSSVGAYVPGGRYTLIASAYMSVIPAKVAGVERVVVATPPRDGAVPASVLYSARRAGADEIYAVGGAQALAAMAYGAIPELHPVDMIVGPGNRYVAEAKRQLFGTVGVDLVAGPTEICIVADESADPFLVACDLVGQAEHDPDSRAILITTSRALGEAVLGQLEDHLKQVATEPVARACWSHGGEIVVVDDEEELVAVCDDYAIEHVEVLMRNPQQMLNALRHYGSLFLGEETTVAYGDKVSGPNHILPTRRAARFTGGLWVGKFLKTVTFQHMDRAASAEMASYCETESLAEGMAAHARTAAVRLERYLGQAQ